MDIDELENEISDLEDAYAAVEDVVNLYQQKYSKESDNSVLNQILDGIQYFINELTLQKQKVEIEMENQWIER